MNREQNMFQATHFESLNAEKQIWMQTLDHCETLQIYYQYFEFLN